MGWWSETIMGGDTPLDIECRWEELGLHKRSTLSCEIVEFIETVKGYGTREIAHQVAAVLLMKKGGTMDGMLRKQLLANTMEDEGELSAWDEPNVRKTYILDLQKAIRNYDGTPTEVKEEGLFDKIATLYK